MALLFSAVTVTAGEDEIELLVGGIPENTTTWKAGVNSTI